LAGLTINSSLAHPFAQPGKVPAEAALTLGPPPDKLRTIYYTLDGTDPRASGGTPSPTAKIYDGPVTLTGQAHLFARAKEKKPLEQPDDGRLSRRTKADSQLTVR